MRLAPGRSAREDPRSVMPNITNPEAFQLEAATVLAAGYAAFPISFPWQLDTGGECYPTETGQSREDIQFQTIQWLIQHDYLRNERGFCAGAWLALSLTERALVALNSLPDALAGKEPLGKRLVTAVAGGGADIIKKLVPAIIQQALLG